jgi:hypothetical protein
VGLIESQNRKHPLVYGATTDDQGRFEIKQVDANTYTFFASHSGYLEQRYKAKGTNREDDGVALTLTANQQVTDVLFRLVRAGVITGKVVDDNGEAMMGVSVSVMHRPTEEEREEDGLRSRKSELTTVSVGETDDRGEYRVYGLKPGEYYVKAAETGQSMNRYGPMADGNDSWLLEFLGTQFAPLYYPGVLQMDQAQAITLRAGDEVQADFAMRHIKLVEVAGKVIAPDGSTPTRSYIHLEQLGVSDWGGELSGPVDSEGKFSIKGVPPGSYLVRASFSEKDQFYVTQQKIEVGDEKIDSLVLTFGTGAAIHGRVVTANGSPLPAGRINVHLQSTDEDSDGAFGHAVADKDGSFVVNGVVDGSYSLMSFGPAPGWFVKSAHLGNEDVFQDGIHVENSAAKGNLLIVISSDGAEIEGTITDKNTNEALPGVQVRARAEPSTDFNRVRLSESGTDQNGHFVLKYVPPGKYTVTAKIPASGGVSAVKSDPVVVTVGDREHRALDIKLEVPKPE